MDNHIFIQEENHIPYVMTFFIHSLRGTLPCLVSSMHAKLARSPTQVSNLPRKPKPDYTKVEANGGFDIYGELHGIRCIRLTAKSGFGHTFHGLKY